MTRRPTTAALLTAALTFCTSTALAREIGGEAIDVPARDGQPGFVARAE